MIDETSKKVLTEYIKDSRQSFREVARKIGISSGTVASRIKEMEENGIINKYSTMLNYEKLGYELTAVTEVTVSEGMMIEVGNEVAKIPYTIGVYNVTGDSDLLIIAKFRSRADLSNFTKSVLKMNHVVRTKTYVVLNTLKEDYGIIP